MPRQTSFYTAFTFNDSEYIGSGDPLVDANQGIVDGWAPYRCFDGQLLGGIRTRWEMAPCHGAPEDPVIRRRPVRPAA